ncbi:MAG: NUDIX hydrolase [Pseudomonadota bacterium]
MDNDSSKDVRYKGNLIEVHRERVDFPQGGHTHFDIVKHPGGAVIAATNDRDELCLLKQWRHAIGQFIWEFPAGCLEPGEPPMETAKRELEEEAAVTASEWRELGMSAMSPGFSNEVLYFYAASNLSAGTQKLDDAEQLEAHWIPRSEVLEMAKSGDIIDAKSLAILLLLDLHDKD